MVSHEASRDFSLKIRPDKSDIRTDTPRVPPLNSTDEPVPLVEMRTPSSKHIPDSASSAEVPEQFPYFPSQQSMVAPAPVLGLESSACMADASSKVYW